MILMTTCSLLHNPVVCGDKQHGSLFRMLFLGSQGPAAAAQVNNIESPVEYFFLFFTTEVLAKVVLETNRYVGQFHSATPPTPAVD